MKGVGGGGNIFGIGTGVAMFWAIAKKKPKPEGHKAKIFYAAAQGVTAEEKLAWINGASLADLQFRHVQPDGQNSWLDIPTVDTRELIPVASKDAKAGKLGAKGKAIFERYSLGISTNRDDWVYDHNLTTLINKMEFFWNVINDKPIEIFDNPKIKLSETLRRRIINNEKPKLISKKYVCKTLYRPFCKKLLYFDNYFIDRPGEASKIFRIGQYNYSIIFSDAGYRANFMTIGSEFAFDLHCGPSVDGFQCLPLYRYAASGERIDNITDWALEQFRTAYAEPSLRGALQRDAAIQTLLDRSTGLLRSARNDRGADSHDDDVITKLDIFHYVYAVLHDPAYREKYALNLKREFPHIPFYPDFWQWAAWGERLMALHTGFETVEPWPLSRIDRIDEKAKAAGLNPRPMLKSNHETGNIVLDSETQLTDIPADVWRYRLGNRTALDWILDQYKEKTPKDPTIREKFNTYRFVDYKEKVIDLLMRVTRVSVETVTITDAMTRVKR